MVKKGYVYYASVLRTPSVPTNTLLHILCISILICSYISGFHRASFLSVTFINQLMHSVHVKTYVI